ncbi:hypothetical protein [Clostridium tagluense]|uniref:hypothetical protein n=1 Tax=Clostridium tagluense TaxID=360422 RepID=UPI001C0C215D|nr:hypothetical protein [Clostridium tagluense]MBU3130554.1 hypothetical protein [Clostridium tagluense]
MVDIISSKEISNWANDNPRHAEEMLPELIKRLIMASIDMEKVNLISFPSKNSIGIPGFDGKLNSEVEGTFIPAGYSVWEMGTNKDFKTKFNEDFEKRSKNSLGYEKCNTTFIFVTSRELYLKDKKISISKEEFIASLTSEWKCVKIIDAVDLASWITLYPSIALWLYQEIKGQTIDGIYTIDQFWDEKLRATEPSITKEFFVIGREDNKQQFIEWYDSAKPSLKITSESKLESLLTIIAIINDLDDNIRKHIKSKMLICSNIATWQVWKNNKSKNIFIPYMDENLSFEMPKDARTIQLIEPFFNKKMIDLHFDVRNSKNFLEALNKIGIDSMDANNIATKTCRKVYPLIRYLSFKNWTQKPNWAEGNLCELVPAILVGKWDGNLEIDRILIEELSGKSYAKYIKELSKWLLMEDSPLFNYGKKYKIICIEECWQFIYPYISEEVFNAFKKLIKKILLLSNSKFELEQEKWSFASVYNKSNNISDSAIEGCVLSLLMISMNDDEKVGWVNRVIEEVFSEIHTWEQWFNIAPYLRLIAEAAPGEVIEKISKEVETNSDEFNHFFLKQGDSMFTPNYYTNVLWALEILVWHSRYANRAMDILAQIANRDYIYKITNSPINSLYEILCLWNPQSCLNIEENKIIIKNIVEKYKNMQLKLIRYLIPNGTNQIVSNIVTPKFKIWESNNRKKITVAEYNEMAMFCSDLLLDDISESTEKWCLIIDNIGNVYQNYRFEDTLSKLSEYLQRTSYSVHIDVMMKLRSEIYRNRFFYNSDWAMAEKNVIKLEEIFIRYDTQDIVLSNKYLFINNYNKAEILRPTPFDNKNYDYNNEEIKIQELRKSIIKEINYKLNNEGIKRIIIEYGDSFIIGETIAIDIEAYNLNLEFIEVACEYKKRLIVSGYISTLINNGMKIDDIICKIQVLSENNILIILQSLPYKEDSWSSIEKMSETIYHKYWSEFDRHIPFIENNNDKIYYISKLLEYNKVEYAIMYASHDCGYYKVDLLIKMLEKYLENCNESIHRCSSYDIQNIFEGIYKIDDCDEEKIIFLEWNYYDLFKYGKFRPKFLFDKLKNDPYYYSSMINTMYSDGEEEDIENKRRVATQVYNILSDFNELPGNEIQGNFDSKIFNGWINIVLIKCNEFNKKDEAVRWIAKLLSYSPIGDDNCWPHENVRNYIENNYSDSLKKEFYIGLINQRGVYSGSYGEAEKGLGDKYKIYADKVRMKYYRTASILDMIADRYYNESKHEKEVDIFGER